MSVAAMRHHSIQRLKHLYIFPILTPSSNNIYHINNTINITTVVYINQHSMNNTYTYSFSSIGFYVYNQIYLCISVNVHVIKLYVQYVLYSYIYSKSSIY